MGDPNAAQRLDLPPRIAGVPADRLPSDLPDRLQGEGRGDAVRRRPGATRIGAGQDGVPARPRDAGGGRRAANDRGDRRSRWSGSSAAPRRSRRIASAEVDATGCKYPWGQYCRSIADGVRAALRPIVRSARRVAAVPDWRVAPSPGTWSSSTRRRRCCERMFGGDRARRLRQPRRRVDLGNPHAVVRSHASDGGGQRAHRRASRRARSSRWRPRRGRTDSQH